MLVALISIIICFNLCNFSISEKLSLSYTSVLNIKVCRIIIQMIIDSKDIKISNLTFKEEKEFFFLCKFLSLFFRKGHGSKLGLFAMERNGLNEVNF